jgi:restriction endonuclease Mrr
VTEIDSTELPPQSALIENGIAVTHYRVLRLPRVDGDYFDAG